MRIKKWILLFSLLIIPWMVTGENASWAAYPERAIDIIVPFGAGGGSDTAARAVVEGMKPLLKHGVVVTNMPGGGATKGMLYVTQQPADGYTILAVTTSHLIDAVKPRGSLFPANPSSRPWPTWSTMERRTRGN
jgi:tripartite-type tricarboxylate transporter receptor subunit TctC